MENVKGLIHHSGGKTLKIILDELELSGYQVYSKVLNSLYFGVPQMRERIYFIGVRNDILMNNEPFSFLKVAAPQDVRDYLIDDDEDYVFDETKPEYKTFLKYLDNKYNKGLYKPNRLLENEYLILDTRQSDLRLYNNRVPTLRTGRHGIFYVKNGRFRKLSGFEALLLQGFPQDLAKQTKNKIADTLLLSQAGNAMTVKAIEEIARSFLFCFNVKNSTNRVFWGKNHFKRALGRMEQMFLPITK